MTRPRAKSTASQVATVLVAIIAIWFVLKLLGVALKLVGVLILIGIAVAIYFAAQKMIGGQRR